jgi:hypothetical protein
MTDQLEADLRDAFSARAAGLPEESAMRLRTVTFHPRTRRLSPKWMVGSLSGVAAATGAIVSVVVLGAAQPAFAGWTATPLSDATPSPTAASSCQGGLNRANVPGQSTGPWNLVDTDVRGPYSFVVYQDGQAIATCFTGPSFTVVSAATDGTATGNGQATVSVTGGSGGGSAAVSAGRSVMVVVPSSGPGAVERAIVSHLDLQTADGGAYTMVEGQSASALTGVTLVRSDGTSVQATVGNGWFVAWWPGNLDVTSAVLSTPDGQSTVTFQPVSPPNPSSLGQGS